MTWLLESPWPAVWFGAIVIGLLAVALVNTGKRSIITAMLGVGAVVLLFVLVEWLVVTDKEQVEARLEQVAVALETNDVSQVTALMAADASGLRSIAESRLPQVEISDANIGGDLQVTINNLTRPPTARAQFTARISGKSRNPGQALPYENYVRRIVLKLRKDDGQWLLTEFVDGSESRSPED